MPLSLIKHPEKHLDVYMSDQLDPALRQHVLSILPDPAKTTAGDGAQVLKSANQRLVLRLPASHAQPTLIAKMFPLRKVSSMLRYRKYAYREFLNGERARRRGINAPIPYSYFHTRWLGLVRGSGLITNDLTGYRDISQVSRETGDFLAAATLAIPAIVAQYDNGIYHGDFRDANLMIGPGSEDGCDYSIIDWQYASFVKPRQEWLLEHLCAFFIAKSPRKHQETLLREGLARVHTAAQPDIPLIVLQQRVERLMRKKMSTRRRLKLTPA